MCQERRDKLQQWALLQGSNSRPQWLADVALGGPLDFQLKKLKKVNVVSRGMFWTFGLNNNKKSNG